MKVHRIITTIEVENDNSITSIELTKLSLDDIRHPLVITNITNNGSANDIKQVYDSISKSRLAIAIKLKSIVRYINESLDNHEMLRRRLTSDVAHELRTPVANVSSNIEAIIEGVLEPTNERLSSCYNELERITGIITELEKLRQIEGENMILHIGHVDIYELAKEVKLIFENEMSKKNIRCDIIGEHIDVCVDKDKMSQVLNNLISNAVKYSKDGGSVRIYTLHGSYGIKKNSKEDSLQLVIGDTGIGISEEDIPRIMERGFTGYNGRLDKKSSGIGLYLCRKAADRLGFVITFDASYKNGTRVVIDMTQRYTKHE